MTNNKFKSLLNKYAIIIAIGYSINFIISVVIIRLIPIYPSETVSTIMGILGSLTWLIQLIINIIVAILISKDLKQLEIKNNLIIIMTILFSLIGLTMFFITINREIKGSN